MSTHVIGKRDCRKLCDNTKISVIKFKTSQTNKSFQRKKSFMHCL